MDTVDTVTARARLEEQRAGLDRSIEILTGERPATESSVADAGAWLTDADRVEAALASLRAQRAAVQAALDRIAEGGYGLCVTCGKPVPPGRLEARPEAARCVSCQSRHDRHRY
ncbi:TraR/DksA family transcriptional regulator [Actinomadura rupiterrae]|uniref:TraR/DksA family transcriptional regulator n=1 Tax=Actinomadura rupiterrae TaxID=559627 RepID=UPI0020A2EA3B|nr:TraR/DksA C4-type zinc finger protein [Actinomadura rupiterrae]MCP2340105.1 RNA polymerase-binding transcription factor DksA [Actinomadura rupiterrae]